MDPIKNLAEQLVLAREIQAIEDSCGDHGEYTEDQEVDLAVKAGELATLVLALNEWMRKGGFSPWKVGA